MVWCSSESNWTPVEQQFAVVIVMAELQYLDWSSLRNMILGRRNAAAHYLTFQWRKYIHFHVVYF